MAAETTYLTREGEDDLRRELATLKEVRRPEFARKLQVAAAQGDLKENADYHDAKEQLGFIEGRIQRIEATLEIAVIVGADGASDEVQIGSTVVIKERGEEDEEEYRIVGPAEANPRKGRISYQSPTGAALLGKKVGDKIRVKTDDERFTFTILAIR